MSLIEIVLLAIALACDCFAVSIAAGMSSGGIALRRSFLFGLFQAMMPLAGWALTNTFRGYMEIVDHWIAFVLLAFIGGRMLLETFKSKDDAKATPSSFMAHSSLKVEIILAIATSIDALAIGVTFVCVGYNTISSLTIPLFLIGIVSFIAGIAGTRIGYTFGKTFLKRINPELFGGVILIGIGIKILITHLFLN